MQQRRPVRRALLSVSDKAGIVEFAQALSARGVEPVSYTHLDVYKRQRVARFTGIDAQQLNIDLQR